MPARRTNKTSPRSFLGAWRAEWPKIAAALTVSFLLFLIPTAFTSVRNWLWPPAVPYPVVCTAEPVWRGGDQHLVEIYFINTASEPEELTERLLRERLTASLGSDARGASTAVLFPYQEGRPKAVSAVPDAQFNAGKGELEARLTDRGVLVKPVRMAKLAILRVNVIFPVKDRVDFDRGSKITEGMFVLEGPERDCFTR